VIAARRDAVAARGAPFGGRAVLHPWDDDLALAPLLAAVRARAGGDRVVCLGGGRTNAGFLEQDLVDRVSLTVSAFVIGADDAPGPFAGRGFPPERFPAFRLVGTRPAGRDLVLEWERDRASDGRSPTTGLDAAPGAANHGKETT
jgi:riboflavin biosynthesis pyrimidine reductase